MATPNLHNYGIMPPGYRLPDATRLGRVRLQVADLDRSIAYYRDVIGLQVDRRSHGSAILTPHGAGNAILELHERPGATPVPRGGRLGLYHFAILLPDRPSLGRFAAHLAAMGQRAGMSDHLVSEALYLYDPDGLGIEVYADRPRSTWRHDGRQLLMATDPLDVDDLIASAGQTTWSGAPAGTVIGHVHLFVSDLDLAAGFFHEGIGFDKVVWSYPGALFMSAGGYHHHLGTNTWAHGAVAAGDDDARMIEWEVLVPTVADAQAALDNAAARGFAVERDAAGGFARDPWGVRVRLMSA
jgi:catechol 2,3-dioxygenase